MKIKPPHVYKTKAPFPSDLTTYPDTERVDEAKLVFIMKSPFQCFAWSGKNMTWEGYFTVQV